MSKNSPIQMRTVTKLSNPAKNEIIDGSNDSVLSNYIREISDYRSLTPSEEKDLEKRAKEGDVQAKKQLIKLERNIQERIISALEKIRIRPESFITKLVGDQGYKLRVGDYRVIMDIDKNSLIILVIKVGHRKNIYNI